MKPNFSKNLFWDIDYSTLNYKTNFPYILARVLDYGTWNDWKEITNYYSIKDIKETALNLRSISAKSLNFISFFTKTPIQEFRCYTQRQSFPTHWNS
ncbi:MAG: hypothetical protein A2033_06095 [Bacteroidetes bacterium GWA2_31_9]|nr:MAG: hypothetical protein A2033_06095 [Bacteroidetes bacterium GWA2_31_9]